MILIDFEFWRIVGPTRSCIMLRIVTDVPPSPCWCCTRSTDFARSCQACGAKRPDPLHRARRQLERKVRHTAMLRGFQHPNRLKYFWTPCVDVVDVDVTVVDQSTVVLVCAWPEAGKSLSRWRYCPRNWEGKGEAKSDTCIWSIDMTRYEFNIKTAPFLQRCELWSCLDVVSTCACRQSPNMTDLCPVRLHGGIHRDACLNVPKHPWTILNILFGLFVTLPSHCIHQEPKAVSLRQYLREIHQYGAYAGSIACWLSLYTVHYSGRVDRRESTARPLLEHSCSKTCSGLERMVSCVQCRGHYKFTV